MRLAEQLSAMMLYEEQAANGELQLASQEKETTMQDELRSLRKYLCRC
jgi:hypothetical protein